MDRKREDQMGSGGGTQLQNEVQQRVKMNVHRKVSFTSGKGMGVIDMERREWEVRERTEGEERGKNGKWRSHSVTKGRTTC